MYIYAQSMFQRSASDTQVNYTACGITQKNQFFIYCNHFFARYMYIHFTDACLYQTGPRPGVIFLFDMSEVRFGHLTRVRIAGIKKFFHYLQEALPAKLCQIHILNVVSFFDKILSLIRPFMRAEIFKVVRRKCYLKTI